MSNLIGLAVVEYPSGIRELFEVPALAKNDVKVGTTLIVPHYVLEKQEVKVIDYADVVADSDEYKLLTALATSRQMQTVPKAIGTKVIKEFDWSEE